MRRPWEERLLEKVQVGPMDECWLWIAKAKVKGYGVLTVDGKVKYAHRLMYLLFIGPIPRGKELDHLCRNPGCVNPWQLEPVTHLVNVQRGEAGKTNNKQREKVVCSRGHPYDNLQT